MAKQKNAKYLMGLLRRSPQFPNPVYDAMLTYTLGSEERTVEVCALASYKDTRREIVIGLSKIPQSVKQTWKQNVAELIARRVESLFSIGVSGREAFDAWHKDICAEIIEGSMPRVDIQWTPYMDGGFSYGFAAYWLDMTFKNMLLMERWDEHLEPIRNLLHLPANSFTVADAAKNLGVKAPDKLWYDWDYAEYISFQEAVQEAVPCPIGCDFGVWDQTEK
jgi:hypothetical protein